MRLSKILEATEADIVKAENVCFSKMSFDKLYCLRWDYHKTTIAFRLRLDAPLKKAKEKFNEHS